MKLTKAERLAREALAIRDQTRLDKVASLIFGRLASKGMIRPIHTSVRQSGYLLLDAGRAALKETSDASHPVPRRHRRAASGPTQS